MTVKDGKNASGSQRYLCCTCARHFTPKPNQTGYGNTIKQKAVKAALAKRRNVREAARLVGVSPQSVANWIKKREQKEMRTQLLNFIFPRIFRFIERSAVGETK